MSTLRVVTWNAEGMFAPHGMKARGELYAKQTRRAKVHRAIRTLQKLDADIVVIPEFGTAGMLKPAHRIAIQSLGYTITECEYDDRYHPPITIAVLSRLNVKHTATHRLGNIRNNTEVVLDDNGTNIHVFAIHLDDLNELNRLEQVKDLVKLVNTVKGPVLTMGDFNAMAHESRFARVVRFKWTGRMSRALRHKQLQAVVIRVHEMARGTTIAYILKNTQLRDMDTKHRRTISGRQAGLEWMPSLKLAKIDWIFGSHHFNTRSYSVMHDVGSDHRPVVAELEY